MSTVKFRFTQQAVYCLAAINTLIRRETGKIYRMSTDDGIVQILTLARKSTNPEVKENIEKMIQSCKEFSPATAKFVEEVVYFQKAG